MPTTRRHKTEEFTRVFIAGTVRLGNYIITALPIDDHHTQKAEAQKRFMEIYRKGTEDWHD